MEGESSLAVVLVLCVLLNTSLLSDACLTTGGCGRGGGGGGGGGDKTPQPRPMPVVSVDRRPPKAWFCPGSIRKTADPRSTSAAVQWIEPTASDSSNPVNVRRVDAGPSNGMQFHGFGSPYNIIYQATDAVGNTNYNLCQSFVVTITVTKCGHHPDVTLGSVRCSHTDLLGSACTAKCFLGYSINGTSNRICQEDSQWSGIAPNCIPIQCPELPGTSCTNGYHYNSICTHSCPQPGYSFGPGQSGTRICRESGQWTGAPPTCVDTSGPSLDCPDSIVAYADPSQTSTVVSWSLPLVKENSKAALRPEQTSGPSSGVRLERGIYFVEYETTDGAGNTGTCTFSISVQVIKCPARLFQPGQRMSCSSSYNYGSVCRFECSEGFVLIGDGENECQMQGDSIQGVWSGDQPTCQAATCPQLTPPANGSFFDNLACGTAYGTWCRVTCDDGYVLTGGGVRRCLATPGQLMGFWDGFEAQCEVQTCPRAYIANHGYVTNPDECPATDWIPAESTCRYACQTGHVLTGSAEVTCGLDGEWDSPFPYCQAVTCDSSALPAPGNGTKNGCPNAEEIFGTVCRLSCYLGFMPTQPSHVTCTDAGKGVGIWNGNTIMCKEIQCEPLAFPSSPGYQLPMTCTLNGVYVIDVDQMQSYTTVCMASCNQGFTSSGSGTRTCLLTGQWDGTPLRCNDKTPPTLMCPPDIMLFAGQGTSYAVISYNWEPIQAQDASGDTLATLISINGQPVPANRSSIFYEGIYRLVYSAQDSDGNSATCEVMVDVMVTRCSALYGPQYSDTSLVSGQGSCDNTAVYGSVCSISCQDGYTLSTGADSVNANCTRIGSLSTVGYWQKPSVDCNANTCRVPALPNGYISDCVGQEVAYQSTCSFVCSPGFHSNLTLLSSTTRTCRADGTWTGTDTYCKAVMCTGFLISLDQGNVQPSECTTQDQLPYNTRCSYRCNAGYSLSGPFSIVCTAEGVWSDAPSLAHCIDYQPPVFTESCPIYHPPVHPHIALPNMRRAVVIFPTPEATDNSNDVSVTSQDPSLGSGSTFKEGVTRLIYTAVDATHNSRRCDVYIKVQVLRCLPLQAPASGSLVKCSSTVYGSTCSFACNKGYSLSGPGNRTCKRINEGFSAADLTSSINDVAWSGQSPTCQPVTCPALRNRYLAIRSGCFQFPPSTELLGTTCNWYCPYGFSGVGSPQSVCLSSGTWDVVDFSCEERSCPALIPATDMDISPADCLTAPTFNDMCFLRCSRSGYKVDPPYNFIRCLGSGDWSQNSTAFTCVDYVAPHFTSCPLDFVEFTPALATEASVTWTADAADNSGEMPSVDCDMTQPAVLSVGTYPVSCSAKDSTGNIAVCSFEVQVKVRRCRPLNPPMFGNFPVSCDDGYGSTCQVGCQGGYILRGSESATCSRNANTGLMYWARDGPRPTCQIASCPPLSADVIPADGGVYPAFCRGIRQPYYGTTCQFICRNGFQLAGPEDHRILTCLANGTWDQNLDRLDVICEDLVPPVIHVCPMSLVGTMSGTSLGASLAFDVPTATDNSGGDLTVVKTPSDIASPYNFTGDTVVSYVFSDAAGNSAECSFNVNIQDNLSPVLVYCPGNQSVITDSALTAVPWREPEFQELTGDELDVSCSRNSGSVFGWGSLNVQCSAVNLDNGKTTMCHFTITVTPTECQPLDAPRNGAKVCFNWNNMYVRECNMLCNKGYDVYGTDQPGFKCDASGQWQPPDTFDHCYPARRSDHILLLSTLQYYSGNCSSLDTQEKIQEQFILLLNQSDYSDICRQNSAECYTDNVVVTCGDDGGSSRRRRAIPDLQAPLLDFDPSPAPNASVLGVANTDELAGHTQKWLAGMRAQGKRPPNSRAERRRLHSPKPEIPGRDRVRSRRSSDMTSRLTISFSMNQVLPSDPTMTAAEFKSEVHHGYYILDEMVYSLMGMAARGEMHMSIPGMALDARPTLVSQKPKIACPFGFLQNRAVSCVGCVVGEYFHNDTMSFRECPVGQYQDEELQFACKMCPAGKTTIQAGSTNYTDCLGICPSGLFSSTGLQPCSKCEQGTYQSQERSLSCVSCPVGQCTASIGSTDIAACTDMCAAGSYSVSGVQPCVPCLLHSYQAGQGQSSCHPCPAGQVTLSPGATDSNMCIVLSSCTATSCLNDGTCVELLETYRCECPVGVIGPHCETDVIDCRQDSCLHGATCLDGRDGFTCLCAEGYEGDDCSIIINYCLDDPCENEGTCTSDTSGFTCTCDYGFTGTTCDDDIDECQSLPQLCQHGGSCINGIGGYQCVCLVGFTGDDCEVNIQECNSNPCQHNGTCVDGINSYQCDCIVGYSGINCEIDVDLCASNPCGNGATCQDLDSRYQCACPRGRGGLHCEIALRPCDYQPCENDGTCTETSTEQTGYRCDCLPGFVGPECKTNVNECSSEPCSNGGTCADGVNSFQCVCAVGFEGPRCERRTSLCDPNPCRHDTSCVDEGDDYYCPCPAGLSGRDCDVQVDMCIEGQNCLNGGSCAASSMNQFCLCQPGYVGEHCEIDYDDCQRQPCINGGICIDEINGFNCVCVAGFMGIRCHLQINECVSSPCRNYGTCIDEPNGYKCQCASGFLGIHCEVNRDDCFPGACDRGQCVDEMDSYSCRCDEGFTGPRCDVDIDECQYLPCTNGAACRDAVNGFTCDCLAGWTGDRCDILEDNCASNPCLNSGQCVNSLQAYACVCPAGFAGHDCGADIDECLSNPCGDRGDCQDGIDSFTCNCRNGWKGTQCQIDQDYCQPNPCSNGGVCRPAPTGFVCRCQVGFEGIRCQLNINDCDGHRCQNGATCIDQANRYSCRCAPDYTGQFCQTRLDLCSAEPCQNNGTCLPTGNRMHHCICQPGFIGMRCEVEIDNCKPNPCLYGSTCINGLSTHTCVCPPGYTGSECEEDIDECLARLCQNQAECVNGINQYQCKCRPGFVGTHCEDRAPSNFDMVFQGSLPNQIVTMNGAIDRPLHAFTLTLWLRTTSANVGLLSYTTQLGAQFAIRRPEALEVFIHGYQFSSAVSVNDNAWHHLAVLWDKHRGTLAIYKDGHLQQTHRRINSDDTIDGGGLFTLGHQPDTSQPNSEGLSASVSNVNLWNTSLPHSIIQQQAQTCGLVSPGDVLAAADFMDKATLGQITVQTPSLCDLVDDCASNPCQQGGTCIDDVSRYSCQCPVGFTGQQCRTNIDDCGTGDTPCDNGGICVDGIDSFTCRCPEGFSGQACELRKVDGGWKEWTDWTDCSQSCEGGNQSRYRSCSNPQPAHGGSPCVGPTSQSQPCNTGPCPACAIVHPPLGANLDCDVDGEEQNCSLSCWPGHAFSQAVLPYYRCGPSSDYRWSHENDDNRGLVFPPCTKYKPPIKYGANLNLAYTNDLACDGVNEAKDGLTHQKIRNTAIQNAQTVKCVQDNECDIKEIQVTGCSPRGSGGSVARRRRRSVEPVQVTITLEHNIYINDQENLTNAQVINNTNSIAAAIELRDSTLYLINRSSSGQFAVDIDNVVYDIDAEQTVGYGLLTCPPGTVRIATRDARCVPCASGYYTDADVCHPCPRGMYQPQEGSTFCQACPRGLTTIGSRTSEESDCNIVL